MLTAAIPCSFLIVNSRLWPSSSDDMRFLAGVFGVVLMLVCLFACVVYCTPLKVVDTHKPLDGKPPFTRRDGYELAALVAILLIFVLTIPGLLARLGF